MGLPAGAIVADVGCGNGKYFGVRQDLAVIGSDRSTGERGHHHLVRSHTSQALLRGGVTLEAENALSLEPFEPYLEISSLSGTRAGLVCDPRLEPIVYIQTCMLLLLYEISPDCCAGLATVAAIQRMQNLPNQKAIPRLICVEIQ